MVFSLYRLIRHSIKLLTFIFLQTIFSGAPPSPVGTIEYYVVILLIIMGTETIGDRRSIISNHLPN